MGVSANSNLLAFGDVVLDHGWLLLHNIHDGDDDLVDVLLCQLLSVLEPLNHVLDELQCHLVFELCAIVGSVHHHMFQIEALGSRWRIFDFDGFEEGISLDDLFTFDHAQLRVGIVGRLLDDELPVAESFAVLENGSVRRGATVESLVLQ